MIIRDLVIGRGEIGSALVEIFNCESIDKNEVVEGDFDLLHICIPYSKDFIKVVKNYQKVYKPKYTVVHSTVPIGTSRKCNALHSPIVGVHPFLVKSIITFTKFVSGKGREEVGDYFRKSGLKVYVFDKPETTELLKILDTTFYGLCIEFTKDIKVQCDKFKVPFEAWTIYNANYNRGYEKLGMFQYVRPNLVPLMKKIGGHCVLPNLELIKTRFTEFLKGL